MMRVVDSRFPIQIENLGVTIEELLGNERFFNADGADRHLFSLVERWDVTQWTLEMLMMAPPSCATRPFVELQVFRFNPSGEVFSVFVQFPEVGSEAWVKWSPQCCRSAANTSAEQCSFHYTLVPALADMRQCGACGTFMAAKTCSRCKVQRYCNASCQQQHWQAHKTSCKRA